MKYPNKIEFHDAGNFLQAPADGMLRMETDSGDANSIGLYATAGGITIDAHTDITLDANGADVILKDSGTQYGTLTNSSGGLTIKSGSTAISSYDSSGDFTGGRIINVYTMGISNLDEGQETWFSWTSTNSNTSNYDNHRMVAPYAGKIVLATFICNDGISNATGLPAHPAVFSIRKTNTITLGGTWTTHTDNASVWADTVPIIGPNPDFGRAGPVEDWAGFSWDAGVVIEAKVDVGDSCGASGARGTMSMVIQWET